MRTSIDLPDRLAEAARRYCAAHGRTLRDVICEGLRQVVDQEDRPAFRLRDARFRGERGFPPGVGASTVLDDVRDDEAGRGPSQR